MENFIFLTIVLVSLPCLTNQVSVCRSPINTEEEDIDIEGKKENSADLKGEIRKQTSPNTEDGEGSLNEADEEWNNERMTDKKMTSIALKAAHDAKEAQECQQAFGYQASQQMKVQFAEKAAQAARVAEAVLTGKQALVSQWEREVKDAQAAFRQDVASCQRTHMNLKTVMETVTELTRLMKILSAAVQLSQITLAHGQKSVEGLQQELLEKAVIIDASKSRVECLMKELGAAKQDLCNINQAYCKAQQAAKTAGMNAQALAERIEFDNNAA